MLKGAGFMDILPHLSALGIIVLVLTAWRQ